MAPEVRLYTIPTITKDSRKIGFVSGVFSHCGTPELLPGVNSAQVEAMTEKAVAASLAKLREAAKEKGGNAVLGVSVSINTSPVKLASNHYTYITVLAQGTAIQYTSSMFKSG